MNRLLDIGFEPAGHWFLTEAGLAFELSLHRSQRNILYAFIVDGQVKYVGKTVQSLHSRMSGYKYPGETQATNVRNHARIKTLLLDGAAVDILALPDNGLLHYGPFHFNLAAGLEDSIIRLLAPEWNGAPRPAKPLEDTPPAPPIASFGMTLQPTYFKQGFFNVPSAYSDHFGADGRKIEIYCGTAPTPILGLINRTANRNHTPRIMGGPALRDWFQSRSALDAQIQIALLSPTALRLTNGAGVFPEAP